MLFTFYTKSFKSVGVLKCYLWDSKAQLWSFIVSSTYNMVVLNVERWLSLIFPGSNLSITINDRSLGWLIIYMDTIHNASLSTDTSPVVGTTNLNL